MKRLSPYSAIKLLLGALFFALGASYGYAQGYGIPFFKAYSSIQYKAHSRNFDVTCDSTGRAFFANFEGLLVYDGYRWTIHHTPNTTRVTSVFTAHDGQVWFAGPHFFGYINDNDSLTFVVDENDKSISFGEVKRIYELHDQINFNTADGQQYLYDGKRVELVGKVQAETLMDKIQGDEVLDYLVGPEGKIFYATSNKGLFIRSKDGRKTYHITTANELPSNCINALAYDGHGSVWGATDNGIFCMTTSTCFTYYYQPEGIKSMVNCLHQMGDRLFIGTLEGLLVLQNGVISPIEGIKHGCWSMVETSLGDLIIAATDGIFVYRDGALRKISDKHALSIYVENDKSFLAGELDGVYRHTLGKEFKLIDKIPNVSKFRKDKDGSLWLINLENATYQLQPGAEHFVAKKNASLTNLFEYTDDRGCRWTTKKNGLGLVCSHEIPHMQPYTAALNSSSVSAMYMKDGIAWVGGTFGIVRWDVSMCMKDTLEKSRLYIRRFDMQNGHLFCAVANNICDMLGSTLYSYRLHHDDAWSSWSVDQDFDFANLSPGTYRLEFRSIDPYGQIVGSEVKEFSIPYPWYQRWYAILFYIVVALFIFYGGFRYRIKRMRKEQERLEAIVDERTQELRDAQSQLIRKEKEATVGKLTQGLIDRILNPMNYINNFSHLTLGLVKDLREDIEDEKENMGEDNYDDCQDVLDMMSQNVEKIEQHGLSTTRILKAMEEMLKERSGKVENLDIVALCSSDIEKLNTYFAKDIERLQIQVDWQKPADKVMANVNADLFSKTIMSMLNNSIYYLIKKKDKGNAAPDYQPLVRLSIEPRQGDGPLAIHIYDNGLGIEQHILDKVFDPFFTTKPTNDASGVGLYLSQQIIQDVGGTISVTSKKGEYTDFVITLP